MINKIWNNEKVYKALFFASRKHYGQLMKHPENTPYSVHFTGVAITAVKYATIMNNDFDIELICTVALLHDTVEDCNVSYSELKKEFGKRVADGVLALSKSKDKSIDKIERMKDSIKRIKKQSNEIALVKLADRLFNIRDVVPSWSEEKVLKYKKEAQLICDELGYACEPLKIDLQEAINKYGNNF